jgi:beta-1,4-mannosyltransferase
VILSLKRKTTLHRRLVFAFPARRNFKENPYNFLFSEAMEKVGWRVVDPGMLDTFFGKPDIIHVHWPQQVATAAGFAFVRRTLAFVTMLTIQKARGAKLVWTAHNIRSHSGNRRLLEKVVMSYFVRLLDGVIYLTATAEKDARVKFPRIRNVSSCQIPHGLYGDVYPPSASPEKAREQFGIGSNVRVVSFIGDVKPYKGLDQLLDCVAGSLPDYDVLIAGKIPDDTYGRSIRDRIEILRRSNCNIHVFDQRLSDKELVDAIAASTIVALPYLTESTSGMAMLVAERGCDIITLQSDAFSELNAQLGGEGVVQVKSLAASALLQAITSPENNIGKHARVLNLSAANAWSIIADKIDRFYKSL